MSRHAAAFSLAAFMVLCFAAGGSASAGVSVTAGAYLSLEELAEASHLDAIALELSEGVLRGTNFGPYGTIRFTPAFERRMTNIEFSRSHRWFTLEMRADAGDFAMLALLRDGVTVEEVYIPLSSGPGVQRYVVDLSPVYLRAIRSALLRPDVLFFDEIALKPSDAPGATIEIHRLGFGPTPLGDGLIRVSRIRTSPIIPRAGSDVRLEVHFENIGAETVEGAVAKVLGETLYLPPVAPGSTEVVSIVHRFDTPGEHLIGVEIEGGQGKEMAVGVYPARRESRQWVMQEFLFTSEIEYENPVAQEFVGVFEGPEGARFEIPGFYDGDNTWRIRFTPTLPGDWSYVTRFSNEEDTQLHGRTGSFSAAPAAEDDNPLFAHGGFLRVSENRRYLTYSDGTPFFWLGDTWWFCPSELCPLRGSSNPQYDSMFKTLIDKRSSQGYTIVQMAFLGSDGVLDNMVGEWTTSGWSDEILAYWREVDEYLTYANEAGILPVIGLAFHTGMDRLTLEQWIEVWRYVIARYAAFPVTWLITGEYNLQNYEPRVQKVLALGQAIKDMDPYKRAMSVHPWAHGAEKRQAWDEPWYDFIMIQGAHGNGPANPRVLPPETYLEPYYREETKPVLEAEANYEGIHGMGPDAVRLSAYRAIQLGSFGYTYGSHGLWYPTQDASDTRFSEWGPPVPWWQALERPGGAQMQHLRTVYESVDWWRLEPRPQAVIPERRLTDRFAILTKADGDDVFVIYFPPGLPASFRATLAGLDSGAVYKARWFNPRTGDWTALSGDVRAASGEWALPARPDNEDWLLIVRKERSQ